MKTKATLYCVLFSLFFNLELVDSYSEVQDLRAQQTSYSVKQAEFGVFYNDSIDINETKIYEYKYDFSPTQNWAIRVSTQSMSSKDTHPVLFVVRQERGVTSWQIPMIYKKVYKYPEVDRTLCPLQNYGGSKSSVTSQSAFVDVSSQSPSLVKFMLKADKLDNFHLNSSGAQMSLNITPTGPVFVQYDFPEGVDVVLVHATSVDLTCAVVSIQDIQCPVFDLDINVEFSGFYQTMSQQAGLTITRQDFPSGSFYVVLVLKAHDYDCNGIEVLSPSSKIPVRKKLVTVTVTPKITRDEYYIATFGILGIFLVFYILSIIISVVCLIKEYWNPKERSLLESHDDQQTIPRSSSTSYGTVSTPRRNPFDAHMKEPFDQNSVSTCSVDEDDDSFDETEVDMLDDADQEKEVFRTKTFLYVADLARKKQKKLSKKSALYTRNLLTIAIFYGVPVVQLVYTYQKVLHVTGNQDICYYNFLCAHPFKVFSDFNHVFSNVGYILLGLLFLGLVWRRDQLHKKASKVNLRLDKYFGIPHHFGLYYSMGLALVMEGILSGSYHVCPNYSNFQFDTAFMYIIASLCMLKIYQSRHPDINANAYSACLTFAIIVLIGVIGVFAPSPVFWIIFSSSHTLCCLLLSIQIYYMGRWRLNCGIFKRIYLTLRNDLCTHFTRPMYPDRLLLLLIANAVNWALLCYGMILQMKDFGTFLLAIFITNLLLYITFYIIMKVRYKEKILPQPKMYIILATLTWISAMYFFLQKSISWQQTPAQSRMKNKQCLVLHFYDVHDIWHFLSSAALFFSFMVLLTLDDDLIYVPRDKIPVF